MQLKKGIPLLGGKQSGKEFTLFISDSYWTLILAWLGQMLLAQALRQDRNSKISWHVFKLFSLN